MDLLALGTSGLLGSNVLQAAIDRGYRVAGTYRSTEPSADADLFRLDLPDEEGFRGLLDAVDPDTVVNCAAMTDVDACESRPDRARAVNATAPGELARACDEAGVGFVQVSTDYVFDGDGTGRYSETAEPNPVQRYGETKLAGERLVREAHDRPLVVRPSFIYGIHRDTGALTGFPSWVRDELRAGESVPLFTDQRVTPSRAWTTAVTTLALAERGASGTYHVASTSCVSPYEFGELIRRMVGAPSDRLERGRLSDVDRPAARPPNTCLDVSKVTATLERPQPALETELEAIADAL